MRVLTDIETIYASGGEVVVNGKKLPSPDFLDYLYSVMKDILGDDADGGGDVGGAVTELPAERGTHEMDPAELLNFWENLIGSLSPAQQAALAAALLAAARNAVLSPHSQALAALSGAVSGGNANVAADIHYAANSQGYGLKMDGAIKGVLDEVRFGR
jgi:hypothetical protein